MYTYGNSGTILIDSFWNQIIIHIILHNFKIYNTKVASASMYPKRSLQ